MDKFINALYASGAVDQFRSFKSKKTDTHLLMLHDEHPDQQRVRDALMQHKNNPDAQRAILSPFLVVVPRNKNAPMQHMSNTEVQAYDRKRTYEFTRGGDLVNGQQVGLPVDMRTGEAPTDYARVVKLVYPVADFA